MARRLARSIPRPRYAAASRRRRVRVSGKARVGAKAIPMSAVDLRARPAPPLGAKTGFSRQRNGHIFSAVAFAIVLAIALGFSWRDGTAGGDDVNADTPAPAYDASTYVTARNLHSRLPFVDRKSTRLNSSHIP